VLRSLLAVLAGTAVWSVLWVACGAALPAALPASFDADGFPLDQGYYGLYLAISVALSVLSGRVTAALARRKPATHGLALGLVLLAIGLPVQLSVWSQMPLWYHLPFLGLLIPACLYGARLAGARPAARSA